MTRAGTWFRLGRGDFRPAIRRHDVTLSILRHQERVGLPPLRAGTRTTLLDEYAAAPVLVAEFTDAVVAGPAFLLFTAHGELVRESVFRRSVGEAALHDAGFLEKVMATPRTYDRGAVLGTARTDNYYHWWLDSVARVWLVHHVLGLDELTWLTAARERPYHRQSLELLGLPIMLEPVVTGAVRGARTIFTPGLAFGAAQALSPMVAQFAGHLQGRIPASERTRKRPLYVTRTSARSRRVINEDALVNRLTRDGFEVVDLSGLSVMDQARLFASSSVVVGAHGAGLTNLLFASPGTGVVELFPRGTLHSSCYRHLASLLSQPYAALEGEQVDDRATVSLNDDLVIDIDQVLEMVEAVGSLPAA